MPKLTKWLKLACLLELMFTVCISTAQGPITLNLEKAYSLAEQNYPAIKHRDLVRRAAAINIDNLSKQYLPQFSVGGQASNQSDVTKIGIVIPGFSFESPSKDQYKIFGEADQLLYDGGLIRQQKALQALDAAVLEQKVEVDLYQLKERINQIFLGILYLEQQARQVELVKNDLQIGVKKVEAMVQNGVAFRSDLNTIKAELLTTEQRDIEIKASRKGYLDMLSIFINQPLPESTVLESPSLPDFSPSPEITRPEIKLFLNQSNLLGQTNTIDTCEKFAKGQSFFRGRIRKTRI